MIQSQILEDITTHIASFKDALSINEHQLHIECCNQPTLVYEIGELNAKVNALCARLKSNLEIISAEIDSDIRANPATYGFVKPTENGIANTIILSEKYKEAKKDLIDANELSGCISALYEAVKDRRSELKNATELFLNKYYSEVDGPSKEALLKQKRDIVTQNRGK